MSARSKSPAAPPSVSLDRLAQLAKAEIAALEVSYGQAIKHAVKAGELLTQAKSMCAHGEWLPWLKNNFELTERTAQRYMLIAQEVGRDPSRVSDLTVRAVRKGLAAPAPAKPRQPEVPANSDMGKLLAKADAAATIGQRELPAGEQATEPPAGEEEIVDAEVVEDPASEPGAGDASVPPVTGAATALALIEQHPGITIPELAARMGVAQNRLYRVLPGLEQEGKIHREGRGWFAENATRAPTLPADPPIEPDPPARASAPTPDPEPEIDPECPGALTAVEERKFLAVVTQVKDAMNLLREAAEEGLSEEAVANALRDASHASRRAAVNLEELASAVEKRA